MARAANTGLADGESRAIRPEFCEVLSEVRIDNLSFKVTWHPFSSESCILWFNDCYVDERFEALGQFSNFEKRRVLDFIVRYATNPELRDEIDRRRFVRRVNVLPTTFFEDVERMSVKDRDQAFRRLFDLDAEIEKKELAMKWRVMAKRYHPDAGGDDRAMRIINEAYEFLLDQTNE